MGIIRSGLAFVVVIVLSLSLVTGNVVTAVDRTALNEEFVTTTLEEEEAYRTGQSIVADEAESRIEEVEESIPVPIDPGRAVNETLTRSYLKNQTEANINRTFRFLNGETDELSLSVNVEPVKDNAADLAEERIRELTVAELINIVTERRDLSVTIQNVTFDLRIVANMSEGPESYRQARQSFRDDIRQVIINRLVSEAYQSRPDNQLLLLIGEEPTRNETKNAQLVAENEEEIKSELETTINETAGDEIDTRVNEQLSSINDEVETLVGQTVNESLSERYRPVADPASDLLMVGVRGLTTNMTYETFDSELSAAKADLAEGVSTVLRDELDRRLDDRLLLTEDLSPSAEERLDQAQQAVSIIGLLAILLPIVALVLIGLLYLITRSLASTAFGSGLAILSAGGGGFIAGTITPGMVESQVQSELTGEEVPPRAVDVAIGIVEQIFGALAAQSLALAILGIVLVIAGLYLRFRGGESSGEPADSGAAAE